MTIGLFRIEVLLMTFIAKIEVIVECYTKVLEMRLRRTTDRILFIGYKNTCPSAVSFRMETSENWGVKAAGKPLFWISPYVRPPDRTWRAIFCG